MRYKSKYKRLYKCKYEDCSFKSKTEPELNNHKKSNHSSTYKCEYVGCQREYFRKSDLKKHSNAHIKEIMFNCQICNKAFISKFTLNRHEIQCSKK